MLPIIIYTNYIYYYILFILIIIFKSYYFSSIIITQKEALHVIILPCKKNMKKDFDKQSRNVTIGLISDLKSRWLTHSYSSV